MAEKNDHVLEEMEDDDFDSLSDLIKRVFRACNPVEHHGRAVPTYNFVQAAEKAGYQGHSIRAVLHRSEGIHACRFPDKRGATIHAWYRGSVDDPPTDRAPRVPRTIRINRTKTKVFPDKPYRLDGTVYRGIELLKMYDAGELSGHPRLHLTKGREVTS